MRPVCNNTGAVLRKASNDGLRWGDVDLTAGPLTVYHALQRTKDGLQLVEPKTVRSRRTIALPGMAIAALRARRV
ncbi:MAG TPA: hypothetical protein VFE62_20695 [Gemmataceae bacterium]|nr:hypothetical protein [Gemmataceae bacterium]